MSTDSPLLKLTLQALDENPDTWGQILNDSALQLLEDAIAGSSTILFTGTTYTLNDNAGGPTTADGARYMILAMGGSPGGAATLTVPTRSKVYLAVNNTGENVTVETAAGTGPTIPDGEGQWVFCNGTDVLAASAATATTAGIATTATDADALIGVAGANYANKTTAGSFSAGQVTLRDDSYSPLSGSTLQIDCALSNSFYVLANNSFTLQAPTNGSDGQQFSLAIQQGAGGPHTIAFAASTFVSAGGASIVLSTTAGDIDYLGFERLAPTGGLAAPFNTGDSTRWVVSQLKDLGGI